MKQLKSFLEQFGYLVHPVLFSLFPLLSLYSANINEFNASASRVSGLGLFNLLVMAAGFLAAMVVVRSLRKASILATVFSVSFLSLGRLRELVGDIALGFWGFEVGTTTILLLGVEIILIGLWLVIRNQKISTINSLNFAFVLIAIALVIASLGSVVPSKKGLKQPADLATIKIDELPVGVKSNLPDVYYIILDAYASSDTLNKEYKFNNSQFLNALQNKGFYVASNARSNYAHTFLSATSTLNMSHLDYLTEKYGADSADKHEPLELLKNNQVVSIFKSFGYQYAHIGTGWHTLASSPHSDRVFENTRRVSFGPISFDLDEFTSFYLQTTALKPWVQSRTNRNSVATIAAAFNNIESVAKDNKPTLTFAHITSPHPPYLFNSKGIIANQAESDMDNDAFADREGFLEQTKYINQRAVTMIDKILRSSTRPPIIVLASDHGPAPLDLKTDNAESVVARMGILNAYYFPNQDYSVLYATITPVNSFRVILKEFFGQRVDLLPDRSYFSESNRQNLYQFKDVTAN